MPKTPESLAALLQPLTTEAFFGAGDGGAWGKAPRHLAGPADRFADLLPFDDLLRLLDAIAKRSPRLPDVLMTRDGVDDGGRVLALANALQGGSPTRAQLLGLCQDTTLVVNRCQHKHAAVGALARMLFTELGEWTTANLYLSPGGGAAGLGYHYDCWEIFVLQLEGTKSWELYPQPEQRAEHPVEKVDFARARQPPQGPAMQLRMTPGDLLYMPRGTWHGPRPDDGDSLHLTLGVHCATQLDVGEWLRHELALDPGARADLPLGRVGQNADAEVDTRAAVEDGLERVRALVNAPNAVNRFLAHRFEFEANRMWPGPSGR